MRKTTLNDQEVTEVDEYKRRDRRNNAFGLMRTRDRGWVRLKNGAIFEWPTDRSLEEGEVRTHVPKGHFLLTINGKTTLFDADEFGMYTRWV